MEPTAATAPLTPDRRRQQVFDFLDAHGIRYTWYEHPEAPTCEIALRYCRGDGAKHCKNLFFRNHKGDRHYLVCFDAEQRLAIRDLEQRLHQGKLSFASEQRMERWLGLRPGSSTTSSCATSPPRATDTSFWSCTDAHRGVSGGGYFLKWIEENESQALPARSTIDRIRELKSVCAKSSSSDSGILYRQ